MRETIEKSYEDYTGPDWELENSSPVKNGAWVKRGEHISYKDTIENDAYWELVKKNQSSNPEIPPSPFTKKLQMAIVGRLEKLGMSNSENILYYGALGSGLDRHGIDAFYEYDNARATIDYTVNGKKSEGYKADVMIFPKHKEIPEEFENLANQLTEILIGKREEILRRKAIEKRPSHVSRRDRFRI